MKNAYKSTVCLLSLVICLAVISAVSAQAATTYLGASGVDLDSVAAWSDGVPSGQTATINVDGANLTRWQSANVDGTIINHTAGTLTFTAGPNNNYGVAVDNQPVIGTTFTYNMSGGAFVMIGQEFNVNEHVFNLSGGLVDVSSGTQFRLLNNGILQLSGSGTLDAPTIGGTAGTMNFVSGWTGSVTIDNLDAAGWETMLATTLAGSTFDGADITTVNFADNFKVVGNTLTIVTDTALEPGLDGANFANAGSWTDGLPSSSRPGTITVDATNLVRAVSSLGGAGWTINHTAGDLQFDGGWNVYGAGSTYNLSGGSIVLTIGDSVSDEGNFLVNAIEFNLGGDTAVDIAKSFGIGNVGVMNFLAGSGTLTAATLGQTSGMMNFTKDWIGSATIDSLNAASWEALLATTLAGSTLDGVDITPENFASNFRVVGSTLTLPPQGTLISIQ